MGRHIKLMEDLTAADAPVDQPQKTRSRRWIGRVPLLPMLALVVAVALVGYAWTTKQISLNFAGAAPPVAKCATASCDGSADQGRTSGARAGRSTSRQPAVALTVRMTSRTTGGFMGTASLANRGAKAVKGWTLTFRMPNAKVVGANGAVLLKPVGATATLHGTTVIAPGKTVRLVFTATGRFGAPASCRLTGALCRIG
jgi:hypothetical protein